MRRMTTMSKNKTLSAAKSAKNDEFYTQYADIQKEINAYLDYDPDVFRGKTVLLPCDDPEWSNFTRFFAQNFEIDKSLISVYESVDLYSLTAMGKGLYNTSHSRIKCLTITTACKQSDPLHTRPP